MAEFRGELSENSLVQAIRDIYNYFYDETGERYTKTLLSDAYKVFVPKLIVPDTRIIKNEKDS